FTLDVGVDHARAEGAWAVEGDRGDEVFEGGGLEFTHQALEAFGLHLEDAGGVSALDDLIGVGIVQVDFGKIDTHAVCALDHVEGVLDNGEVFQAEEVKLYQTGLFDFVFGELGDELAAFTEDDGDVIPQFGAADD